MFKPVWRDAVEGFVKDQIPRLSAAFAFYVMLTLSPLALLLVAAVGFVYGSQRGQQHLFNQIGHTIGQAQADFVQSLTANHTVGGGLLAGLVGLAIAVYGGSGLFDQLSDGLKLIFRVSPKHKGVKLFLFRKAISFLLLACLAAVVVGWIMLDSYIRRLHRFHIGFNTFDLLQVLSFCAGVVFWSVVIAAAFRFIPGKNLKWRDVVPGAVLTSVAFGIGKYLLGIYFSASSMSGAYGSAGAIVVTLLWVYYSAQIFFFGAEFACCFATRYGSLRDEPKPAEAKGKSVAGAIGVSPPA